MKLSIGMITARKEPKLEWFLDSLNLQTKPSDEIEVIVVDLFCESAVNIREGVSRHPVKPSVWQGPHRLTRENWWAISSARNTFTCLAKHDFVAFTDDRCVLATTWLQSVRDAMEGNYAVAGSYEKRSGMKVENGKIIEPGEIIGVDFRNPQRQNLLPRKTYGSEWYGCTSALPLEWVMEQNGHSEDCDGLGLEDVVFGNMLMLNNHVTMYDSRMKIIEDRTPEFCQNMPKRTDKDASPNDKSHALLVRLGGKKFCDNQLNLRSERERVLRGEPWTPSTGPTHDWYDGQPLGEMTVQ